MSGSWRDVVGAWACCGLIAVGAVALFTLSGSPGDPHHAAAPGVVASGGSAIPALLYGQPDAEAATPDRRRDALPAKLGVAMAAAPREKICPPFRLSNVVSVSGKQFEERMR